MPTGSTGITAVQSAISHIRTDNSSVYAFEISNHVAEESMNFFSNTLTQAFEDHQQDIDVLLIFSINSELDTNIAALFSQGGIKAKFQTLHGVNRLVMVGAPLSVATAVKASTANLPLEVHTYRSSERVKAYALLHAQPRAY